MEEPTSYYNDLIAKYFSGEADEKETTALNLWLEADPEHLKVFSEFRKSWEALELFYIQQKVDVDKEWALFEKSVQLDVPATAAEKPLQVEYRASRNRRLVFRWAAVAAVFLILCISGVLIYRYSTVTNDLTLMASTENREGTLPDGSRVTLAPGSSLVYPEKFKKASRVVKLQGEGFFEVSHNPEQPFLIEAGNNVRIEVLGTSFYVNTCNPDSLVEVVLTTGRLAVYRKDQPGQKTLLEPGEKVVISDKKELTEKSVNTDVNYIAWKSGKLVFSNTPLKEVARQLSKVYHVEVSLTQPEIGDCTITATFENQSADAVLHVIEETLSLTVSRKGNKVEIRGTGCTE